MSTAALFSLLASLPLLASALDCTSGVPSATTTIRNTLPVPYAQVLQVVGPWANDSWTFLPTWDYVTTDDGGIGSTRNIYVGFGYTFREELLAYTPGNRTTSQEFRWQLINGPQQRVVDGVVDQNSTAIQQYVQDLKLSPSCKSNATLIEYTVEYCAADMAKGYALFQTLTAFVANSLADQVGLNGSAKWDVGCDLASAPFTSTITTSAETTTSTGRSTSTTSTATATETSAVNAALQQTFNYSVIFTFVSALLVFM